MENTFTKTYHGLVKRIGLTEAYLLSYLTDLQVNIFNNGRFFQQRERIIESTGLSIRQIKSTIKILEDLKIIKVDRGHGNLNYYTVIYTNIDELIAYLDGTKRTDTGTEYSETKRTDSETKRTDSETKRTDIHYTNNYNKTIKNNKKNTIDTKLSKVPKGPNQQFLNKTKENTMLTSNEETSIEIEYYFDEMKCLYPKDKFNNIDVIKSKLCTLPVDEIKLAYSNLNDFIKCHGDKPLPDFLTYLDKKLYTVEKINKLKSLTTQPIVKLSYVPSKDDFDELDEPTMLMF